MQLYYEGTKAFSFDFFKRRKCGPFGSLKKDKTGRRRDVDATSSALQLLPLSRFIEQNFTVNGTGL